MENKLISMVDFVLEQSNNENLEKHLCNENGHQFMNYWHSVFSYAKFLKQPLKLGMFVPCDENDVPLGEPKAENYFNVNIPINELTEKDAKGLNELYSLQLYYQDAKDRVLFEGVEIIGQSEGFCEIELKNGDFWMTFIEGEINVTNQFNQEYRVHVIEDLIQEDLILTASAIKQFEL